MAVRDEDLQPAETSETRRGLPWRDTLGHIPALLLLGGVLMYAYLSLCYDLFYRHLGIDPNDVGLSYTGTLTRSSGFVIVYLAAAYLVWLSFMSFAIVPGPRPRELQLSRDRARIARALTCIAMAILLWWPMRASENAAKRVQAGNPVTTIRLTTPPGLVPLPPFPVLAIHADPSTVEPAGKPGDSPAAERLRGRRLLYLGQSGGTVVLYDAAGDRAVYVPASAVILHVANCRREPPPDPAC